jgi:hemoglobin/transferrin/lactoferrin receptor protein
LYFGLNQIAQSTFTFSLVYLALAIGAEGMIAPTDNPKEVESLPPLVVTSQGGFTEPIRSTPWSTDRMEVQEIGTEARSMPEALNGLPSVMVQKTALGQSSPYIRGLTGYHNLLLVEGIRLNHSAMRSGPNQYWSTVEMLGSERIEVVRGPNGIIHGADAIGGVVNLLSANPSFSVSGVTQEGDFLGRLSSAERSWSAGLQGTVSSPDWFAELSHVERSFGDLQGGKNIGKQINVGYDSHATNFRLSRKTNETSELTLGIQRSFMDDVPRTHKTVDGLTWEGLSPGSERWRRLDQERDLYYGKFSWEDTGGFADQGIIILSLHRHGQERNRMKELTKGGDFQFFELDDYGLSARFEANDPWGGRIGYGAEIHHESLSSGGYKFDDDQVRGADLFQGPLAADANYKRYSIYVNDSMNGGSGWIFEPGIRISSVCAELERYYLKNSDASTRQAPETKKYDEWIGSLRVSREMSERTFFFGGLSQGFRPPSAYDLTSTDETSINEAPNVDLSPENFAQVEMGLRGSSRQWNWQASYYHTWIKNMIVRSPYQATTGKTLALKANGDGFVQGIEIALGYDWDSDWKSNLSFSWMDSEVEQLLEKPGGSHRKLVDHDNDESTAKILEGFEPVDRATTRSMPVQLQFLTRYAPATTTWWGELSILAVAKADHLSLKDETDHSRIPDNGTPGYTLFGLRGGHSLGERTSVTLAAENLSDEDYRVHGSGLNGPGRNFILSFSHSF